MVPIDFKGRVYVKGQGRRGRFLKKFNHFCDIISLVFKVHMYSCVKSGLEDFILITNLASINVREIHAIIRTNRIFIYILY